MTDSSEVPHGARVGQVLAFGPEEGAIVDRDQPQAPW